MTIRTELAHEDGRWHVVDDGTVLVSYDDDQVRLSLSWKAKVYADKAERARAEAGEDGVGLDEALARLEADLGEPLAGRTLDSADLRAQLNAGYSAYAPSLAPA
jgi:hypothetical protein